MAQTAVVEKLRRGDPEWSPREKESLWEVYDKVYEIAVATTPDAVAEAQRVRYDVYCLEKGFEDPKANPQGLEKDAFDDRSVHCLLRHRQARLAIGTARLILPNEAMPDQSWPIQQVCRDPRLHDEGALPRASTAEVSRFCLSTIAKARAQAAALRKASGLPDPTAERRVAPYTMLGIIRGLLMMSRAQGISHWALVVEPAFLRLLDRIGLRFMCLGPAVSYHGLRQPCFAELAELFATMRRLRPDLWAIVTAGGALAPEEDLAGAMACIA